MSGVKSLKSSIVDWNVSALRKLNMSDKTIGYLLRSFHAMLPMYTTAILLFGPQIYGLITIGILFVAFISFWIFGGCLISSMEYKLDNIDVTLMDPLIEIMRMEVNHQTRLTVATHTAWMYMVFSMLIYYIRFGSIRLHNNVYDAVNIFKGFFQWGPEKNKPISF
jgi:hypothetical protein